MSYQQEEMEWGKKSYNLFLKPDLEHKEKTYKPLCSKIFEFKKEANKKREDACTGQAVFRKGPFC